MLGINICPSYDSRLVPHLRSFNSYAANAQARSSVLLLVLKCRSGRKSLSGISVRDEDIHSLAVLGSDVYL